MRQCAFKCCSLYVTSPYLRCRKLISFLSLCFLLSLEKTASVASIASNAAQLSSVSKSAFPPPCCTVTAVVAGMVVMVQGAVAVTVAVTVVGATIVVWNCLCFTRCRISSH